MAGDPTIERSSMDSKERVIEVGVSANGLNMVVLVGDDPTLLFRDPRGRTVSRIHSDALVTLTKALLEAQAVIMPVDEVIASVRKQLSWRDLMREAADVLELQASFSDEVERDSMYDLSTRMNEALK